MKLNQSAFSSHKVLAVVATSNTTARMAVRLTKGPSINDELDRLQGKLNKMPQKMQIVRASVRPMKEDSDMYTTLSMSVAVLPESKPATASNVARMTALAGNMFVGGEKNEEVWDQHDGTLVKRCTVESAEHLERMLTASVVSAEQSMSPEASRVAGVLMASTAQVSELTSGMYAVFSSGAEVLDGYIVAMEAGGKRALILPCPDDNNAPYEHRLVAAADIIEAGDLEDLTEEVPELPEAEKAAAAVLTASDATLNEAIAYYKKVYGYNPAYFARIKALLKERGSIWN